MGILIGPKIAVMVGADQGDTYFTEGNAQLRSYQALVQSNVINLTTTAPPGSPANGDTYVIASGATGAWSGKATQIAYWTTDNPTAPTGEWNYFVPQHGWVVLDVSTNFFNYFSGSVWTLYQVNEAGIALTDITTNNVSTSKHGFVPKAPNDVTKFLDGTGAFSVPGGGSGNVSTGVALTNHAVVLGAAGSAIKVVGSVGNTNTVLHGNTGADPNFSPVVEADIVLADNTTNNSSTIEHGFLKKLDSNAAHYMGGDGNWSTPVGTVITLETDGTPNGSQTQLDLIGGTNITLTDGGSGSVTIDAAPGIALQTDSTPNVSQTLLNLVGGTNISCTDDGSGSVTIASTGGSGVTLQTNSTPNGSQTLLNLTNGTNITLVDDMSGMVTINGPATTQFETNGSPNGSQTLLNLVNGTSITLADDSFGNITINGPAVTSFETGGSPNGTQTLLNLVPGVNMSIVDDTFGNITFTPPAPITLQTNNSTNANQVLLNILNGTGMTITDDGSGDITFSAYTGDQTQNLVFAAPDGSNGPPTFRALVVADVPLPTYTGTKITSIVAGDGITLSIDPDTGVLTISLT